MSRKKPALCVPPALSRRCVSCNPISPYPYSKKDAKSSVTHRAASNIALLQLPELVSLRTRLVDLPEGDVHEVVAVDEMAVERFAVLELDQLGVRGCAAVSLPEFSPARRAVPADGCSP